MEDILNHGMTINQISLNDVNSSGINLWSEKENFTSHSIKPDLSNDSISCDDEIPSTSSASPSIKLESEKNNVDDEEFDEMDDSEDDEIVSVEPSVTPVASFPFMRKSCEMLSALQVDEVAPACHKYINSPFTPTSKNFSVYINKERKLLENDLPPGIVVKTFENRLDLFSALIEGPVDTPYEGCLFLFDIQLHKQHPRRPPKVHYWAFCEKRLNPNLYTRGRVCLSLLGTWLSESSSERWSVRSTIYQLLISIQSLILVQEPYYNEPAYHDSSEYKSESKIYNGRTLLLVLKSIKRQIENPPEIFREQTLEYYRATGATTYQKLQSYMKFVPPFPLDLSKVGQDYQFTLSMFETATKKINI